MIQTKGNTKRATLERGGKKNYYHENANRFKKRAARAELQQFFFFFNEKKLKSCRYDTQSTSRHYDENGFCFRYE